MISLPCPSRLSGVLCKTVLLATGFLIATTAAFAVVTFTQPIQSTEIQVGASAAAAGVISGNGAAVVEWKLGANVVATGTVGSTNDWKAAAAGASHVVALKLDGSLWTWGSNGYGQLGDGTAENRNSPRRVGADKDWVKVFASGSTSGAIKADGSLWTWGGNNSMSGIIDPVALNLLRPRKVDTQLLKLWTNTGLQKSLSQVTWNSVAFVTIAPHSSASLLLARTSSNFHGKPGSCCECAALSFCN